MAEARQIVEDRRRISAKAEKERAAFADCRSLKCGKGVR